MNRLRVLALCAGFAAAALAGRADSMSPGDLAPDETLAYLELRDLTALREAWKDTSYYALWQHPGFAQTAGPIREMWDKEMQEFQAEGGVAIDELLRMFPGEAAVFLSELIYEFDEERQVLYKETNRGLIARLEGERRAVRRMVEEQVLGEIPTASRRSTDSYRGIDIYTTIYRVRQPGAPAPDADADAEPKPGSLPPTGMLEYHYEYAFVDDWFILLEGQRAFMKKILANYMAVRDRAEPPAALSGTANWQRATRDLHDDDLIVGYVNIERYLEQLSGNPEYKMVIDQTVSMRLREVLAAAGGVRIDRGALEGRVTLQTTPDPEGVASILINDRRNAGRALRLAPRESLGFFATVLDPARAVAVGAGFMGPFTPLMRRRIADLTGVDPVTGLLARLGGEVATISLPAAPSDNESDNSGLLDTVFVSQVNDEEALVETLGEMVATLKERGAPIALRRENYRGVAVHVLRVERPAAGQEGGAVAPGEDRTLFRFAFDQSWFVGAASPDAFETVMDRLIDGQTGELAMRRSFRRTLDALPGDPKSTLWIDLSAQMRLFATQPDAWQRFLAGRNASPGDAPDPELVARHLGALGAVGRSARDSYRIDFTLTRPEGFTAP